MSGPDRLSVAQGSSVAQLLATALAAAGTRFAFTVPGESFLPLLDALDEAGIRVIATRHEGGAAFMAESASRVLGAPQACLGTRAVGSANLSIGVHTARQDSTPMFAVVGQVQRTHRGREAFQEVDQVSSYGGVAKWASEIDDPLTAGTVVGEGIRRAISGRPGPVLFSVPEDVWTLDAPSEVGALEAEALDPPDPADVDAVFQLLAGAERPVILAGGGVLRGGATMLLVRLAAQIGVPVVAAWRRPDVFPHDHPLYLGMTGYGAAPTVLPRLLAADAMLVIGCRLNEVASFDYRVPPAGCRWAHVDLEPAHDRPGLRDPDVAVRSEVMSFLDSALRAAPAGARSRARAAAEDRAAYEAARVVDGARWEGPGVHPGRVITTLQRLLPADAILTTDAGNFGGWAARGYRWSKPGTFLGPTSGAMGYGLPAAIGASLGVPGRVVVALSGDGGFAMTMSELETAVRVSARVVAVVFDNGQYGTIRMHQDAAGTEPIATDLGPIDFAAYAQACGAAGFRVESDGDLEPALLSALAERRPAVVHLQVDRRWRSVDDGWQDKQGSP